MLYYKQVLASDGQCVHILVQIHHNSLPYDYYQFLFHFSKFQEIIQYQFLFIKFYLSKLL